MFNWRGDNNESSKGTYKVKLTIGSASIRLKNKADPKAGLSFTLEEKRNGTD